MGVLRADITTTSSGLDPRSATALRWTVPLAAAGEGAQLWSRLAAEPDEFVSWIPRESCPARTLMRCMLASCDCDIYTNCPGQTQSKRNRINGVLARRSFSSSETDLLHKLRVGLFSANTSEAALSYRELAERARSRGSEASQGARPGPPPEKLLACVHDRLACSPARRCRAPPTITDGWMDGWMDMREWVNEWVQVHLFSTYKNNLIQNSVNSLYIKHFWWKGTAIGHWPFEAEP